MVAAVGPVTQHRHRQVYLFSIFGLAGGDRVEARLQRLQQLHQRIGVGAGGIVGQQIHKLALGAILAQRLAV